jgi:putative ABC transport system permease protein
VQGVSVKGQIHNLRKVKWNSFQPNFFVLFQEGVLEGAPKIYLAGVYGADKTNDLQLQNEISKVANNVSVIGVSGLIKKILELSDRLTWSMQALSMLTLLVGLVILYSLVQFQLQQKAWDLNLLKVLGINARQLRLYILIEYMGPVALSILIGSLISLGISWVLMKFVFSSTFSVDWIYLVVVNFLIMGLTAVLILLSTAKTLDSKPRLA